MKTNGGSWQAEWHFVTNPWVDDDKTIDEFPEFELNPLNITLAISEITAWLKGNEGYNNGEIYKIIMEHSADEKEGKSLALRLLIHYIGDIHQPLHSIVRVDENYPKGDLGGNSFRLPEHKGDTNLHAVWDDVLYQFGDFLHIVRT